MDNPKGKLQIILQKTKHPLPIYDTKRVAGDDHIPFFESKVSINYGPNYPNPLIFKGKRQKTKKAAETQAALKALSWFERHKTITKISVKRPLHVLIDLENVPATSLFEQYSFDESIKFNGFFANGHHLSINPLPDSYPIETFTIQSTRKDSCDIGIVMYATRILLEYMPHLELIEQSPDQHIGPLIIIVTKDRFGAALTDLINENFLQIRLPKHVAIRAIHVTTIKDLFQSLQVFVT